MRGTFLQQRIEAVKTQIVAAEEARSALTVGGIQSYTFGSGQSTQTVTRHNLAVLQNHVDRLYNQLATLEARAGQGGTVVAGPAW